MGMIHISLQFLLQNETLFLISMSHLYSNRANAMSYVIYSIHIFKCHRVYL